MTLVLRYDTVCIYHLYTTTAEHPAIHFHLGHDNFVV